MAGLIEYFSRLFMMDKSILREWLKAGFIEKDAFHNTESGAPQGGLASPTLANITLDGLEKTVSEAAGRNDTVYFVRYADDFICTAKSKEILENKVLPAIIKFLKERGLELSFEKTKISHINDGFDFLGFNIRKYGGKLLLANLVSLKSLNLKECYKFTNVSVANFKNIAPHVNLKRL